MDSILELRKEQLVGWYDTDDRLRVGGVLRWLQQAGSVVNFLKASYPGEERPLQHFPEFTQRFKAGVEALVARGVPYREADRASDHKVQAWPEPLYAAGPRPSREGGGHPHASRSSRSARRSNSGTEYFGTLASLTEKASQAGGSHTRLSVQDPVG